MGKGIHYGPARIELDAYWVLMMIKFSLKSDKEKVWKASKNEFSSFLYMAHPAREKWKPDHGDYVELFNMENQLISTKVMQITSGSQIIFQR